jgi:hypothetical protein
MEMNGKGDSENEMCLVVKMMMLVGEGRADKMQP